MSGYFPPKDRSGVVNLLQNARWRFSQIAQVADGQAEPELINVWAKDGFDAVQKVLDCLDTRQATSEFIEGYFSERYAAGDRICPHCLKVKKVGVQCCQGGF